jgi:hypothetical protein
MPKAIRTLPPVDYLRQCFDYDPDTGILRWRERPPEHFKSLHARNAWNAKWAGNPVGTFLSNGYLHTSLSRRKFYVSRLIWKMHHGIDPLFIDHADRDQTNNRVENLRSVTNRQNAQHSIKPVGCSGFTGVYPVTRSSRYRAAIKDGPKMRHLGTFATAEEAHAVYRAAAKAAFGEFDPRRSKHGTLVEDEGSP